jgi:transposase
MGHEAFLGRRLPASQQSQICVVARDRRGGYAVAAKRARPHAIQVADRRHLTENARSAFLNAPRKSMRQIRAAMGATEIDPSPPTFPEKQQYERFVAGVRTSISSQRR